MKGNIKLNDLIHLFKSGFRTVSGFHIPLATLLGITGFIFALREGKLSSFNWSPNSQIPDEKFLFVPGLQNLGNNCFLNVILQALASCSSFQSFVQKAIEECERSSTDENVLGNLPLALALDSLFEELCVVDEGKVVLSPRRVMLSMAQYIPSFNLTAQQDAAEAFLHLLSSLREEIAFCYDTVPRSLLELCSSSVRIIDPKRKGDPVDLSDQERWQKSFIGPFDGILGSILTCQSCSSQISLNFEAFHSLPLSPVPHNGSSIISGCSLEDCLKKFTVAEQVENYHCASCWHIGGVKYLTSTGANEVEIEKLKTCSRHDSCDCRKNYKDIIPWSNRFSRTLKQISIARSPKILCIQLKRVSMNMFGDLVKLQGHISFPMILDLSSFMTNEVAIKTQEESIHQEIVQRHYQKPILYTDSLCVPFEPRNLDNTDNGPTEEGLCAKSDSNEDVDCPKSSHIDIETDVDMSSQSVSSNSCLYRLVSVVEHFGRAGSGHYTVYRSERVDLLKTKLVDQSDPDSTCWFCVSDSQVHLVSESDVLSSEASLLFYERMSLQG